MTCATDRVMLMNIGRQTKNRTSRERERVNIGLTKLSGLKQDFRWMLITLLIIAALRCFQTEHKANYRGSSTVKSIQKCKWLISVVNLPRAQFCTGLIFKTHPWTVPPSHPYRWPINSTTLLWPFDTRSAAGIYTPSKNWSSIKPYAENENLSIKTGTQKQQHKPSSSFHPKYGQ